MADYDLSTITAALSQNYRPKVVRTFNATSILLRTLRIERGAGKNIAFDYEDDGATAENFSDGADVSNYGSDVPAPAVLGWALYRANWLMTNLALASAGSSQSPADLIRPQGRNLVNAVRKLTSTLNDEMHNGLGTGTLIAGLDVALDDANTYATVNRTSVASMRSTVIDPGSPTAITLAGLRKDLYDIKDVCGELPDLAFCPSAVFLKIASLFDNVRRWEQDITINTGRGQIVLDASVGKLQIEGCTFLADKDATASHIKYINSNYVHVEYLPSDSEALVTEQMMEENADDGFGPMPLGMNVYALARTGAARKMTAEVMLQLVVQKPSACGVRKNILTT